LTRHLRDLVAQAEAFREQGLTAGQATDKVDLRKYAGEFPHVRAAGGDIAVMR
jgi:hypothetical protein